MQAMGEIRAKGANRDGRVGQRLARLACTAILLAGCGQGTVASAGPTATPAIGATGVPASAAPATANPVSSAAAGPIDPGTVAPEAPLPIAWEAATDGIGVVQPVVDASGRVWVGAVEAGEFWAYDQKGKRVATFDAGTALASTGHFGGMAFGPDGRRYVADADGRRLLIFDADGELETEVGGFGGAADQFYIPNGVSTGPNGTVFVHDDETGAIKIFQPDGTSVGQKLVRSYPSMFVDASGNLWLVRYPDKVLAAYAPDGSILREIALKDLIDFPLGIAVDAKGNILVGSNHEVGATVQPDRLLQLSPDGKLLHDWEGMAVEGVALDATGTKVYVTFFSAKSVTAYDLPVE